MSLPNKKLTIEDIEKAIKLLKSCDKPPTCFGFTSEVIEAIEADGEIFDMVNMKWRGVDFVIMEPIA